MAEDILFNVAASITTKLGALALQEFELIWGVNDELHKLEHTVSTIKAVILDAEEQQSKSNAVKEWILRLKDAFYDVDDLIDEFSYEKLRRQVMMKNSQVRLFFSKSNQVVFRLKMGHKIKEIREKLNAIAADGTQFHFIEQMRDTRDNELKERQYTHSFIPKEEVIGRDADQKKIIDFLLDTNIGEDVSVIAIVGMGGLGKTTLAQFVYNHEDVTKHFDLKLWVCISKEFDVKMIVESIIESATKSPKPGPLHMDSLQFKLRKEIDGKKYLLVMDDVWNEDRGKWINLKRLLMGGAKGSKIVVTTRSELVANTSEAAEIYRLGCLSKENSWHLFKQMAFGEKEVPKDSNLIEIGKEVVQVLKGVPLAIRVIGSLLYLKESKDDWFSFKNNELSRIMSREENELQSILMLSYKHLPYDLKRCFTYCALFPKDYKISTDEMIRQWIAQGFVQPVDDKPIEAVGDHYFMELSWRSFFQEITKNDLGDIESCKMHDLMHDLACSIVRNECTFASVDTLSFDKRTRHILFNAKETEALLELLEKLFEVKNVRTFMLQLRYYPADFCNHEKVILDKLLSRFLQLRTLDLSYCKIEECFECIGKLKHLRYIDLSGNTNMKSIPNSITDLYNLETLILVWCPSLRELPRDTKNLINLRHLDIRGCSKLTHMPKGLNGLTALQKLSLFVVGKDEDSGLSELNGLDNLKGSLCVRGLNFCRAIDLNTTYLKPKRNLRELKLKWLLENDVDLHDHESVLKCLQPHHNLRKLYIKGYQGVRLSDWLSFDPYVHLVCVKLSSCKRLEYLPQFDKFPSLKDLWLENLPCIKYIDSKDSFSSASVFIPSLKKLKLRKMPKLERWWKGETSTESAQKRVSLPTFTCLSELVIEDCRKLTSFPTLLPLQSLDISGVNVQFLDMVMKTTTEKSSSSQFVTDYFCLSEIDYLEFLSEDIFLKLVKYKSVDIRNCRNLDLSCIGGKQQLTDGEEDDASVLLWKKLENLQELCLVRIPKLVYLPKGLQHLTTLETLTIMRCENLLSLPEWIVNLTSLKNMEIGWCPKLTLLPRGMCHLTSLKSLDIFGCESTSLLEDIYHLTSLSNLRLEDLNIASLPKDICHLTSLSTLMILDCVNLTCLPEGMGGLKSLRTLTIWNCSILEERCKKGGEDWPKISHVPEVYISPGNRRRQEDSSVRGEEDGVSVVRSLVLRILRCCLPD